MKAPTRIVVARVAGLIAAGLFLLPAAELVATIVRSHQLSHLLPSLRSSQSVVFWRGVAVQLVITATGTVFMTAVVLMAAYGLSLLHGRKGLVARAVFVLPMVINGGLIPTYIVVRTVGLIDHPLVLLLTERVDVVLILVAAAAFSRSSTLREAAGIDGAGPAVTMLRIVFPAFPHLIGLIAALSALRYWNSWYPAFLFVHSAWLRPAQNILRSMAQSTDSVHGAELLRTIGGGSHAQVALYALLLLLPGIVFVGFVQSAVRSAFETNNRRTT